MNKLIIAVVIAATGAVTFAENAAATAPKEDKRPLAVRMAEFRNKSRKPTGGRVVKKYDGKIIAVFDRQTIYTPAEVEAAVSDLRQSVRAPFFRQAPDAKPNNVGVTLVLTDELTGDRAKNVLAAPEEGYAEMSVRRLVVDNPKPDWKARRLRLEILRAAGMAMGVGYSMYQPCVMRLVRSLDDLDKTPVDVFGPEGDNNFNECGKAYGIGKIETRTYRAACREGWAPKPANEEQQKIWDEINTLPSEPLKIKFDPKRDK